MSSVPFSEHHFHSKKILNARYCLKDYQIIHYDNDSPSSTVIRRTNSVGILMGGGGNTNRFPKNVKKSAIAGTRTLLFTVFIKTILGLLEYWMMDPGMTL